MRKNIFYILLLSVLINNLGCTKKDADLVVINAKIYTADDDNLIAKSIAINKGKILEVSDKNLNDIYQTNEILDAKDNGVPQSRTRWYCVGFRRDAFPNKVLLYVW